MVPYRHYAHESVQITKAYLSGMHSKRCRLPFWEQDCSFRPPRHRGRTYMSPLWYTPLSGTGNKLLASQLTLTLLNLFLSCADFKLIQTVQFPTNRLRWEIKNHPQESKIHLRNQSFLGIQIDMSVLSISVSNVK